MANPFAHSVPQPQQNGYPIPSHDYYSPSYQPSHLANTPTYQTYNGPTYSINNGHLAAPQMGPDPQTTASTYDVSRPGTAYSGMSGTAVASQQSHGEFSCGSRSSLLWMLIVGVSATGDGYRRSRGESDTLQACDNR